MFLVPKYKEVGIMDRKKETESNLDLFSLLIALDQLKEKKNKSFAEELNQVGIERAILKNIFKKYFLHPEEYLEIIEERANKKCREIMLRFVNSVRTKINPRGSS